MKKNDSSGLFIPNFVHEGAISGWIGTTSFVPTMLRHSMIRRSTVHGCPGFPCCR
jgi:hypothetical protein